MDRRQDQLQLVGPGGVGVREAQFSVELMGAGDRERYNIPVTDQLTGDPIL